MEFNQNTLAQKTDLIEGIGLHSGEMCSVQIFPAEVGEGIVFVRTDEGERISLSSENTQGMDLRTVLANKGAEDRGIQTIEHLVAALCGMGVDNAVVKVNGPEVPILDGSALPWAELIMQAQLKNQGVAAPVLRPEEEVCLMEGNSVLKVKPYDGLRIAIEDGYPNLACAKGPQVFEITPQEFFKEIAPARTFCMVEDIKNLNQTPGNDLVKSFDYFKNNPEEMCALVFNPNGTVQNNMELRFADEPLRHKVLDFMGDLFVNGKRLQGDFYLKYPRHALNSKFLEEIAKEKELA